MKKKSIPKTGVFDILFVFPSIMEHKKSRSQDFTVSRYPSECDEYAIEIFSLGRTDRRKIAQHINIDKEKKTVEIDLIR